MDLNGLIIINYVKYYNQLGINTFQVFKET